MVPPGELEQEQLGLLGSASRLKTTTLCPTSQWLEQGERPESWDEAAARGTAIHTYLETGVLDNVPEKYHPTCLGINLDATAGKNAPVGCRELKFCYDLETGKARIDWTKGHRNYGEAPHLLWGTADVVIPGFHSFEVYDYKTGKRAEKAAGNPQLLFLALCTRLTLCPYAKHGVIGIQQVKELKRGVELPTDSVMVDGWDLLAFQEELHAAYKKARAWRTEFEQGKINVKRGDYCWFCPARKSCPAFGGKSAQS